jgi:acetyl-CoA synthetase
MALHRPIGKDLASLPVPPNLRDYEASRRAFSWAEARGELAGLPGGGLNIAHEAVDRHALGPRRDHVALRILGRRGEVRAITYGELRGLTSRFADALHRLGVARGDRVFSLCGRIAELYVAALGTLKAGAVFCPLFSAFGPEPIRQRMAIGGAKVLVTTPLLYANKVAPIRGSLPDLEHVVLAGAGPAAAATHDLAALLAAASPERPPAATRPDDLALLHFTSGTTGRPKGAMHVHEAVVAHRATAKLALDLHPEDVFWCTADPGWVTGTSYGIVAPLCLGLTSVVDEADFDAERWYSILAAQRVSVWYTAPTAVRMLRKLGGAPRRFPALRFVASVGEPLDADSVLWGCEALGLPIHDNWWQTETGGIMIANYAAMDIEPGSMGKPLPGIEAAVVRHGRDGRLQPVAAAGEQGELALRPGWPSMFRGYLGDEERYARCFRDGWYLSGDLVQRDAGGYYWFVGRADDVIKTAGHLVGPFEVESALLAHPAVAEAGVIGKPDPVAGETVKAFVALKPGYAATAELRRELHAHARRRLGAAIAPKEIDFIADLPKTRSGKVMRRLLKARELGLPEGDTSTLEAPA